MLFLGELYASTRQQELAQMPWSDEQKRAFLAQQFAAQHQHYVQHYPDADFDVLLLGRERIGRLYVEEWPSQVRLIDIAISTEHRNRGYGRQILEALKGVCTELEKPLTIHVEKQNPAMRLYRRLGFETVEDKGVYDLMEWRPQ